MQANEQKVVVSYNDETVVEKRNIREKTIETIIANIKIVETRENVEDNENKKDKDNNDRLVALDIIITIDSEMFTLLKAHYDTESFEHLKEEKELCIEFEDFPKEIANLLSSSQEKFKKKDSRKQDSKKDVENTVYFMVEPEQCSLCFFDVLSFKEVEIFRIPFKQAEEEESHVQAQNSFTEVKKELLIQTRKLKVLNNEIKKQCPFMFEYIKKQ